MVTVDEECDVPGRPWMAARPSFAAEAAHGDVGGGRLACSGGRRGSRRENGRFEKVLEFRYQIVEWVSQFE